MNEADLRRGIDNAKAFDHSKLEISSDIKEHNRIIRERFLAAQRIPKNSENLEAASKKIRKGRKKGREIPVQIEKSKKIAEKKKFDIEDLISWEKRRKDLSA